MSALEAEIRKLSDTLIYELTKALALPQNSRLARAIRPLFEKAALRVAEIGANLDRIVAEQGLAAGARWLLPRFVKSFAAHGVENIPSEGPLVIAANHPAAYDSIVISAHVTRPDYKIIIGDIPFFENLPHVSQHAIYAPDLDNLQGRMRVVRASIRHLMSGGALLIFARGGIEADPSLTPQADSEFERWSRSLEIFLQHVPQTSVLVTIVSGVIARAAMHHPITWFRRARPDRQRLAMMIQIVEQVLSGKEKFGLTPRVSFGDLISLPDFGSAKQARQVIVTSARQLLADHLAWQV